MSRTFYYSDPGGIDTPAATTDLGTTVVRYGTMALSEAAELGEPAVSGIDIDDPDGTLNFVGLRAFTVTESTAPALNRVVYRGTMENRTVTRGPSMRTSSARIWSIDLSDVNWVLSKRVLVDADAKRPDETAGDRLRWLIQDSSHFGPNDHGHVTYPSDQMEANDYRGQRPLDVLADCAVETGYNFWCAYNETFSDNEVFFLSPGSSSYTSAIQISNDLTDLDLAAIDAGTATIFPPYEDAQLVRSAARIAFGVYLAYNNGSVYVRNTTTGAQFAKIDQVAPMANVKREARARRIANHFLNDNDEEDDRVTCSIKVPWAQVNAVRAGHRMTVKFTHLPGWQTPRDARVLRRTVVQEDEGGSTHAKIVLELTPVSTASAGSFCATSISTYVAATTSEGTPPEVVSMSVTPLPHSPSFIFGAAIAANHNVPVDTNLHITSGGTEIYANDASDGFHPTFATAYTSRSDPSSSVTMGGGYTGGFNKANDSQWATAMVSVLTSATAPVQTKSGSSTATGLPSTVTLTSPPTPGNMIIIAIGFRDYDTYPISDAGGVGLVPNDGGWTAIGVGEAQGDNTGTRPFDTVQMYARCVETGEGSEYGHTGLAKLSRYTVIELAIT